MTRVPYLFLFLSVAAACGGRADATREAEPKNAPANAVEAEHGASGTVTIDSGMLRDLRITTTKVESRKGGDSVLLLGELTVNESTYAEVGTSVAGTINRVLVGLGESVSPGQPVLELQSVEVGRARAEFIGARARLTLADRALARKRALFTEKIAPEREVQEAEAEVSAASSAVRAAEAELGALGLPSPTESNVPADAPPTFMVRSPVAGTVIERRAVRGQRLEPGAIAMRIADLSSLWLTAHAFERDAVRVRARSAVRVTFSALPGQEFLGEVLLVGNQVNTDSRTIDVRIAVRNKNAALRPGMSASASVPIGGAGAEILTVPVTSVQRVGGEWCVFSPKSDSVFIVRKIGRGRDLGTEVEVLSGLSAGEVVVVDGAFLLRSEAEKTSGDHDDH